MILFAVGYNLKKRRFFRNIAYIGFFGVIGTIVNFALTSLGTYLISSQNLIYAEQYFGEEYKILC